MKVKELIKILQSLDPEREVILQKDIEGNGFSPLNSVDGEVVYVADSNWSGQVYLEKLTQEQIASGYSEMDLGPMDEDLAGGFKRERAVVFYPIN